MQKSRSGERQVSLTLSDQSDIGIEQLEGKDVIVLDDMVRTGSTIIECCRHLRAGRPRRVCFGVTHFYASPEGRENLNRHDLDEILTLNTIPSILNRDTQGRLRKKMVVLKIEKWIARFLLQQLGREASRLDGNFYSVDMSSKNPRWLSNRTGMVSTSRM
jgi:ribose-phosphate pyrophosphokinase